MRRWLAIGALFGVVFLAPAWAQRRGGGFAGGGSHAGGSFAGSAGHSGFAPRGPVTSYRSFGSSGFSGRSAGSFASPRFGGRFGPGFHQPFIYSNRFGRRGFYGAYWPYAYAGGYYIDPGFYSDYDYPAPDTSYPAVNASGYDAAPGYFNPDSQYQQSQIDRLEDEVTQLRQQRAAQSAADSRPQPATVLVFGDKHSEEVQNYAIVGETLWIFNEAHARKVPMSELDIRATQRANEDHGIDFRLPQ